MPGQQIIHKRSDDGVRFIAEPGHDTADQRVAACVPFQVNCAMRGLTMDLGPAMRATGTLMFGRNQIESPELRIRHDFVT